MSPASRTPDDVTAFLDRIADPTRRADCNALVELMSRVTRQPAAMWPGNIVGFGRYHYRYESGREGDWATTGFSPRRADISVYLVAPGPDQPALLERLGRHRMGTSCLSIRRLADVDMQVLEALVASSVAELARIYGHTATRT